MKACKKCPFRADLLLGYTQDGLDALDDGREPACHVIVGKNLQFDDPMPSDAIICKGFLAHASLEPGFCKPYLQEKAP